MALSATELQRYARHLVLPQVGQEGQERLRAASVLIIGLGGLGSPAALYLAAAGVGRIGLLDDDVVAVHNLQRQVVHDSTRLGEPKVGSARVRIEALNPHVRVETWETRLTSKNARGIVSDYDVVLDGTDSFATRYLVNDACVLERRPNVHASVHRFEGQLSVFAAGGAPCYRCIHPEPPPAGSVPDCAEGGVLGVLPGILGTMQAAEALKLILGIGTAMTGRLLVFDALRTRFHEMAIEADPSCAWCGTRTATSLLDDYAAFCGTREVARTNAWESEPISEPRTEPKTSPMMRAAMEGVETSITPAALVPRLAQGTAIVVDVREPWELTAAPFDGAIAVPMSEIPARHGEFPRDRDVVVLCHHGQRSAMVAEYLRAAGFPRVLNLTGGIERWSIEVDPSVPRY
jgi:molybdopterin/thiamine biosynthesis adenylyltransferase/rhodanese-related sulfurtransferase